MSNVTAASDTGSEEASSSTPAKRGPGRPKGAAKKPEQPKNGAWIYDETEELVFVEGAEPADEVVCDGALTPGLTIDPDGTRIWNCAAVGGVSAIRRRLRQGDPKAGEKLAKNSAPILDMCESLKRRKRCVRWGGAAVVLQYVFKPQVFDARLSSARSARGCLVAMRQSPSVAGFISDVLHGPLIIDFADTEVSAVVADNALDIAAWMRKELLAAWSDGKIDESAPVRAVVPGTDLPSGQVFCKDGRPPVTSGAMTPETIAAREMVCEVVGDDASEIPPVQPTCPVDDATCDGCAGVRSPCEDAVPPVAPAPEPPKPRTVADYLRLPISIKANTESAEMGTGDTLEAILDAVCGKEGCDWPKWRLGATTAELRQVKESGNENLYKTLKRTRLPVYYPSATWLRPRREKSNTENVSGTTGLVCLDFDHFATAEAAAKARDEFAIANCEHLLICALSVSGRGFYAVTVGNTGGTVESYKAEATRLMEWAREQGYDPDTGCTDCTRGRILAVDADAIRMADDWPLTPPVYVMPPETSRKPAQGNAVPCGNDPTKKPGKKKVMAYVARAVEKINAAPEGSRNTAFTSACGTASRICELYGYDREDAEARLRFAGETSGLDSKEIESVLRRYGPLAGK